MKSTLCLYCLALVVVYLWVLQGVCCSVLQRVAACCSVLQCVAVCCSVLQCVAVCCKEAETSGNANEDEEHVVSIIASLLLRSVNECVAACCSVLQHVVVCCSML